MPPKEYTTGTQASSIYCLHLLITYASNINEQGSTLAQLVGMAGPESTSTRRSRIDVCGRLTKQVDGGSFQAGSSDQHCKALRLAFGNFQAVGAASSESFGGWRRALDTSAQRVKTEFMNKELSVLKCFFSLGTRPLDLSCRVHRLFAKRPKLTVC